MRFPLSLCTITLALVAAPLGAQNLVSNGSFETGNTAGWSFGGHTLNAKVDAFDTTGGGASKCFNNMPGGKQTPGPYPVNWMEQDVLIIQGVVHEFRADIATTQTFTSTNADGGTIVAYVDGVAVATHAFGSISSMAVERTRLCGRIVPKTTGKKKLRITFHRRFLTALNRTPTCFIDNIFLGRTSGLTVCFPGERKAGATVGIQALGNPGNKFAIFLGVGQQTPALPIPGWTGAWELKSPYFPLVIGTLDTSGQWRLAASVPASAKGAKAWIQGAMAASSSPVVNLGFGQEVNVY